MLVACAVCTTTEHLNMNSLIYLLTSHQVGTQQYVHADCDDRLHIYVDRFYVQHRTFSVPLKALFSANVPCSLPFHLSRRCTNILSFSVPGNYYGTPRPVHISAESPPITYQEHRNLLRNFRTRSKSLSNLEKAAEDGDNSEDDSGLSGKCPRTRSAWQHAWARSQMLIGRKDRGNQLLIEL